MRLGELDTIFLSYREPHKERLFSELRRHVPGALRVDGVEGFFAAFQACAGRSRTSHFLMIDGDTRLLDSYDPELKLPELREDEVLTWASRNAINGLVYGNGCLKLWPKEALLAMRPEPGFRSTSGYFIDSIGYRRLPQVFSETVPNGSPEQAYFYGFREVFRSCVDGGWCAPPPPSRTRRTGGKAYLIRTICTVGSDVRNGVWANLGGLDALRRALTGTPWDLIGDRAALDRAFKLADASWSRDPEKACRELVDELDPLTDLELRWLPPAASAAHKASMD